MLAPRNLTKAMRIISIQFNFEPPAYFVKVGKEEGHLRVTFGIYCCFSVVLLSNRLLSTATCAGTEYVPTLVPHSQNEHQHTK